MKWGVKCAIGDTASNVGVSFKQIKNKNTSALLNTYNFLSLS